MATLEAGYRSITQIVHIYGDRFLAAGAIAAALTLGAIISSSLL